MTNAAKSKPVARFATRCEPSACRVRAVIVRHHCPCNIAQLSAAPLSVHDSPIPLLDEKKKPLSSQPATYSEKVGIFSAGSIARAGGFSFSSASKASNSLRTTSIDFSSTNKTHSPSSRSIQYGKAIAPTTNPRSRATGNRE